VNFTQTVACLQEESFLPQHTNRFSEADLLTRTLVAMVADLFNIAVIGHSNGVCDSGDPSSTHLERTARCANPVPHAS
jgi:hypothetical protein